LISIIQTDLQCACTTSVTSIPYNTSSSGTVCLGDTCLFTFGDTRHASTEPIRLRRLLSRWYDANGIVLRFVSQTRQLRCSNYLRRFPLSILTKSPPTRSCARSRLARPSAVRHARFVGKAGAGLLSSNIDRGWLARGGGCGSRADHIHVQQSPEPRPEAWTDGRTPSSRGGFIDR